MIIFLLTGGTSLQFSLVIRQYNMSAYLKPFWEWMSSVKQSLEWGKRQCLFSQPFNKLSPFLVKLLHLSYVILENQRTRFAPNSALTYIFYVCRWTSVHSLCLFSALGRSCVFYDLSLNGACYLLQICHEFERFSTYLPEIKVAVFYGGVHIGKHKDILKNECPHIVVGTPGRILALARDKDLSLRNVRHFILDECDKMLESLGMIDYHLS